VLDGEVIALDLGGRQEFRLLVRGQGNLHYAVFDVLWRKGKDLRRQPLWRRKRTLERLIAATSTALSRVFAVEGRGRDLFRAAKRLDLEGIVAKRKADSYSPTRSGTRSRTTRMRSWRVAPISSPRAKAG
jgi:ATP-dependent DNA ligase